MKESLLSASHRLRGENLQVLAEDVDSHLSNASAGIQESKKHSILYDGVLNDKVGVDMLCHRDERARRFIALLRQVVDSLQQAKSALAEFRLQASQGVRQDRALAQSLAADFSKVVEKLEQEQRLAEAQSREGLVSLSKASAVLCLQAFFNPFCVYFSAGIIGGDELSRKKAAVAAMKKAAEIQADSMASLHRSVKIVGQTERVGVDTAVLIRAQTEQIKDIYADTSRLSDGLRASNRLLTQIARRACQDRITAFLFVLLVLCIVGAAVARFLFKPLPPEPWPSPRSEMDPLTAPPS